MNPYIRERCENWVSDFCTSDALHALPAAAQEFAAEILLRFLIAACEPRDCEPADIEEADVRTALLTHIASLELPESVRRSVPTLCANFLEALEDQGRLSGGRALAAFARALSDGFAAAASKKPQPIVNPGARIGRNDPCPCGSGKKYKKCCQRE